MRPHRFPKPVRSDVEFLDKLGEVGVRRAIAGADHVSEQPIRFGQRQELRLNNLKQHAQCAGNRHAHRR